MHRAPLPVRAIAVVGAAILFILAGGGALAAADDFLNREVLPFGSKVAGIDVAGLTREQAREIVQTQIAAPLAEPLDVTYGRRSFSLDAGSMLTVDVAGMVDAAFAPQYASSLPQRVVNRALRTPSGGTADVALSLDEPRIAVWLDEVAASIDTTPSDATMTVEADRIVVLPSRVGETVNRAATAESLEAALTGGVKSVELVVDLEQPEVTEQDLGTAILVDLSERRLYFYDKGALVKEYGVAVGAPGFSTPRGNFVITLKRYMPTWSNPGSAWAAGMPKTIPPGPQNPLGTRAMNLDAPGIRIHGTSKDSSIGTAASHGCLRMHRWDVEELYEKVDVGTPVFIVR